MGVRAIPQKRRCWKFRTNPVSTISKNPLHFFPYFCKLGFTFFLKCAFALFCKGRKSEIQKNAFQEKQKKRNTMIYAFLNQKGGVGKTTLAIHFAAALAGRGARVLLLDADPQGSALDWSASRGGDPLFSVVGLPKPTLHRETPKLSTDYDHIVIDGPPRVYDVARSAILASDLVLIPVQPSPYDVWAAKEIVDLLHEAAVFKETQKSAFVINRKIVNTAIGRDVNEALSGYNVPVLTAQICQRVAFAESAAQGQTVLETDPHSLASQEILALTEEVLGEELSG
jgi:chromosome partitioning protein